MGTIRRGTMFQRSIQRETADDNHICVSCKRLNGCTVKPDSKDWRFVLRFCAEYEEDDK